MRRPRSDGAIYDAFLDDYRQAEKIGQSENATCSSSFDKCPISLFELFQGYSTIDDKPAEWDKAPTNDNNDATDDELQSLSSDEELLHEKQYISVKESTLADGANHIS